jgi:hypothetical protein
MRSQQLTLASDRPRRGSSAAVRRSPARGEIELRNLRTEFAWVDWFGEDQVEP